MKWRPKISYGSGPTVLTLTYPQKLWTPGSKGIGGSATSDGGVPEVYQIRRDQICKVEIRFLESEWPNVATWLEFAQQGNAFDYWFDQSDITTKYTVFLDEPKVDSSSSIEPSRDSYPKVFHQQLTIRSTSGTRFNIPAFV